MLRRDLAQLALQRFLARSPACRGRGAARCGAPACGRSSARACRGSSGPARGWRGGRPCPRRPARCRARWCRSCLRRPRSRAAGRARDAAAGSGWRSRRCAGCSASTLTPCASSRPISSPSAQGSTTTPLPITDSLPGRTTPEGSRDELVGLAADHQRVAGVVAALEAHDDVGALGQPVDDLAFALVAPLGADHHHVRHLESASGAPLPPGRARPYLAHV